MVSKDPTTSLVTLISEWIINMALLNLIWFSLTLLGGVLFGWGPATVAVMAVQRQQFREMEKVKIWEVAWSTYRKSFLQANGLGWLFQISGLLLLFYSFTLTHWNGVLMFIFAGIFFMIALLFAIALIFIFPVYVHYELNFFEYVRYALTIGLSYLHVTVMMGVSIAVIVWAYTIFPGLMLVFAMSLPTACLTYFSLNIFGKIEARRRAL